MKAVSKHQQIYIVGAVLLAFVAAFTTSYSTDTNFGTLYSLLFILMSLPTLISAGQWRGKRGIMTLLLPGIVVLVAAFIAVTLHFPYGDVEYTDRLGMRLCGLVPWPLCFIWGPLVPACLTIANRASKRPISLVILSGILMVAVDMVIEPAAVSQKYWFFIHPGKYFQIPLSNFLGWVLTGTACAWGAYVIVHRRNGQDEFPASLVGSGFLMLSFWTAMCYARHFMLPAWLGLEMVFCSGYVLLSSPTAASAPIEKPGTQTAEELPEETPVTVVAI